MPDLGSTNLGYTSLGNTIPAATDRHAAAWGAPPDAPLPMPTQTLEWRAVKGRVPLLARLRLVFALRAGH